MTWLRIILPTVALALGLGSTAMASDICMRLEARLNALDSGRAWRGDERRVRHERADLIRGLAANRCGRQYETRDRSRRHGLFAQLFGGLGFRFRDRWGPDPYFGGTYRTLCVRTCDGYYFPISFATVESHFAADEQACQAMCPGTEVALYVHRNPGEGSNAMVSLAGEPYTALPTAFRYRKEYDAACTCGRVAAPPPGSEERIAVSLPARDDPWGFARPAEAPPPIIGDVPVPERRPMPGEDPETLANRAGSFRPAPALADDPTAVARDPAGEKSVRIVGPAYYYGQ